MQWWCWSKDHETTARISLILPQHACHGISPPAACLFPTLLTQLLAHGLHPSLLAIVPGHNPWHLEWNKKTSKAFVPVQHCAATSLRAKEYPFLSPLSTSRFCFLSWTSSSPLAVPLATNIALLTPSRTDVPESKSSPRLCNSFSESPFHIIFSPSPLRFCALLSQSVFSDFRETTIGTLTYLPPLPFSSPNFPL